MNVKTCLLLVFYHWSCPAKGIAINTYLCCLLVLLAEEKVAVGSLGCHQLYSCWGDYDFLLLHHAPLDPPPNFKDNCIGGCL